MAKQYLSYLKTEHVINSLDPTKHQCDTCLGWFSDGDILIANGLTIRNNICLKCHSNIRNRLGSPTEFNQTLRFAFKEVERKLAGKK